MYCFCRSSKTISVRIIFLDETDFLHEIQVSRRPRLSLLLIQLCHTQCDRAHSNINDCNIKRDCESLSKWAMKLIKCLFYLTLNESICNAERIMRPVTARGCVRPAQSPRDILLRPAILRSRRTNGKRERAASLLDGATQLIKSCTFISQQHWLDANQRLSRQLKESKDIYELYFSVKFYAVDPCKLIEEITRYQFYLQLKQDVLQGRLPVTYELASQLGAYVVQCE